MTAPTREAVVAGLRTVTDPCSLAMGAPIDIWCLGLVETLGIAGGRVTVGLVLTDFSCVYFQNIRRYVTDALLDVPGVDEVDVELVTTTLWTADRMRV